MHTDLERAESLFQAFEEKEFRDAFVKASISDGLAMQLRLIRESRGWSQATLAERTGMKQSTISRLEDPNYGRFTISSLLRLASAMDVAVTVTFESFSTLAHSLSLGFHHVAIPTPYHGDTLERGSAQVYWLGTMTDRSGPLADVLTIDREASFSAHAISFDVIDGSTGMALALPPEIPESVKVS